MHSWRPGSRTCYKCVSDRSPRNFLPQWRSIRCLTHKPPPISSPQCANWLRKRKLIHSDRMALLRGCSPTLLAVSELSRIKPFYPPHQLFRLAQSASSRYSETLQPAINVPHKSGFSQHMKSIDNTVGDEGDSCPTNYAIFWHSRMTSSKN